MSNKRAPDTDPSSAWLDLKNGGVWLAAARKWLQRNVPGGDSLMWGTSQPVSVSFVALQDDFAREVAVAAVEEERRKRARETLEIQDRWRLERENEKLRAALKHAIETCEVCISCPMKHSLPDEEIEVMRTNGEELLDE